jgi:endonuclease YncB( thermonuclease family)
MPDHKLALNSYNKLVADITSLFEGVRRSLAEACWKTGRWIVQIEQKGLPKAAHGSGLLQKLSEDLTRRLGSGFSYTNLKNMRRLYLASPNRQPAGDLPLSHHIELLTIQDGKKRLALEKRAEKDRLDRDSLRTLVRHEKVREKVAKNLATLPENREPPDLLPAPKLGPLNMYRIKDPNEAAWPDKNCLLLDHGFKVYRALTPRESRGLKAGDIAEWTGTNIKKTSCGVRGTASDVLYTYKAYLESVIDGDTFWVALDIGAGELSRQKLRLRGIDCPEIDTQEGQAAKKFVESVLKDVPSLTVFSSRNATYDRYEADVFLTDRMGHEVYLNNLLLEKGYAVRVRD